MRVVSRHAFTLLEVLVVVAIIALLATVLLPGLRQSREQSRRVACQANLRQLARGWHSYLDDNKGWFFQNLNADVNYGGAQGLDAVYRVPKPLNKHVGMRPVTRDPQLFRCPADRGTRLYQPTCNGYFGASYVTNLMMIGPNQMLARSDDPCNQPPDSPDTLIRQINRRIVRLNRNQVTTDGSRLVLMGDLGWWNTWYFPATLDRAEWHARPYSHNLAFMDGHAEFIRIRKGLHVTDKYVVVPFSDLLPLSAACQKEVTP